MEQPRHDIVAFPALLRAVRGVYREAINAALAEVGCDDVPRSGSFVLGSIARQGTPMSDIIRELGVSKQAAGQLVDTLVLRGYLHRSPDPEDRRCMQVALTERGSAAAAAARGAIARLEAEMISRVGADQVAAARSALGSLVYARRPANRDGDDPDVEDQGA